jgi:hypothetical protein
MLLEKRSEDAVLSSDTDLKNAERAPHSTCGVFPADRALWEIAYLLRFPLYALPCHGNIIGQPCFDYNPFGVYASGCS